MGTNSSEEIPDKHSTNRLKRSHKAILVIMFIISGLFLLIFGAAAIIIWDVDTGSEIGNGLILFAFIGCLILVFLGLLLAGISITAWKRPDIGGVLSLVIAFLLIANMDSISLLSIIPAIFAVFGVINIIFYHKRRNNNNLPTTKAENIKTEIYTDDELYR